MIDNFDRYREFINLMGGLPQNNNGGELDKCFYLEVCCRGKDFSKFQTFYYRIKEFYIFSWQELDVCEKKIKYLCDNMPVRAYGSVNCKSMSQIASNTIDRISKLLSEKKI